MRTVTGRPTLWHIPVSHYSEKARWALAYKGIEHDRHAPPAGPHMLVALWLTRGGQVTLPVLELDGERIGDSTAIIAALERRFPEPPLYPEDPRERRAALELEAFYDEELGPAIRRLVFHELRSERDGYGELAARTVGGALPGPLRRLGGAYGRAFTSARFRVAGDEAADRARPAVRPAPHASARGADHPDHRGDRRPGPPGRRGPRPPRRADRRARPQPRARRGDRRGHPRDDRQRPRRARARRPRVARSGPRSRRG